MIYLFVPEAEDVTPRAFIDPLRRYIAGEEVRISWPASTAFVAICRTAFGSYDHGLTREEAVVLLEIILLMED